MNEIRIRKDEAAAAATRAPRAWLWVCALTIGLGLAAAVLLQPWTLDFLDARRVLAAGEAWAAGGDPYAVPGYFYTPALAVVASILPDWSIATLCPRRDRGRGGARAQASARHRSRSCVAARVGRHRPWERHDSAGRRARPRGSR